MTEHPPLATEPRGVRPPYHRRDDTFDHITPTDAWRVAVRLDRLAALLEPLVRLEITEHEHATLEWLSGWSVGTVGTLANLLHRARTAAPLDRPEVSA